MRDTVLRPFGAAVLTAFLMSVAAAAPPASCARKFVGTWAHSTGTTTVSANGQAYPHCPMCVSVQYWTCQGNTYLFSNSGPPGQFSATLISPNQMSGAGGIATRIGGGRAVAAKDSASDLAETKSGRTKQKAQAAKQAPAKQTASAGTSSRQSCSDITGTKGGGESRVNCPKPAPKKFATGTTAPPKPSQGAKDKPATPAAQRGAPSTEQQTALAGNIIDELGRVRSGQIASAPQSATGASQAPDFDPKTADPHRASPPPPPPQAGQSCVPYFENMQANFKRNAALCLKDTVLLRSLTDMVENDISTVDERDVTRVNRNSIPQLFAYFDPLDPRWVQTGDIAYPNCDLPLTVATQREAFMECARVYLCGMGAATCGLNQARQKETNLCLPISQACIARYPVPQRMAEDPTPRPYTQPVQPALPNPPQRNSTITGPSGPGGGGSSGGVRSAQ